MQAKTTRTTKQHKVQVLLFFIIFGLNFTTMKKYILFLLLSIAGYGQTSTGQEQEFPYGILVPVSVLQVPTTTTWIGTFGSDGTQGKVAPQNISIPQIPSNYVPSAYTIGGHLDGIDTKLGSIVATTAGQTTRVWFTADGTTVGGNPYYQTGTTKGTAAIASQSVSNDDNQKKYFTQDVIGAPFVSPAMFPPGVYAGNLSASTTPNSAQQRWTVELYKCDNSGTPIASGVTGAAVGSLGVTVITILDSGLLTLADGSVTNVQVSGNLGGIGFSINAGERVRYHVSAEKVGTAASNITQSVYYGTSYNSFIDVTVPLNTNSIVNLSTVAGVTTTDALNSLNAAIPVVYSTVVYVNATDPNSATIFDDVNPPVSNDPLLEDDVDNLYVGTDASGWVYNSTSLNYVTKTTPSASSVFYNSGTTIPASNTTAPIERTGSMSLYNSGTSNSGALTVSNSTPSGYGIYLSNSGTGTGFYSSNLAGGNGVVSNSQPLATGYNYLGLDTGAITFSVDKFGSGYFADKVGIKNNSPTYDLDVSGISRHKRLGLNGVGQALVSIIASDAKTSGDAVVQSYQGLNASNSEVNYSRITSTIVSSVAGSHSGKLTLSSYNLGTQVDGLIVNTTGEVTVPGTLTAGIKVRKISTNTTLTDSDNGTVILLTASCTVTLPNGLASGFNVSFSTATGATLTYALGGSVTLINNTGTTMAQNLSHTIVNTGTSNEYLVAGSL